MNEQNFVCGIIGDGFFTEILLTAIAKRADINPSNFYVACKTEKRCTQLREEYNARAVTNMMNFLPNVKILILALAFGENFEKNLENINKKIPSDSLIISCTYNLTIKQIEKFFPGHPIIRVYLNPTVLTSEGICVYTVGGVSSENSKKIAKNFFDPLGTAIQVDSEIDLEIFSDFIFAGTIATAALIESLIECGVKAGISVENSKKFVFNTVYGTSESLTKSDSVVEYLINQGKNQKKVMDRGKELLEKYGVLDLLKKFFDKPVEREIFKFHYHWKS